MIISEKEVRKEILKKTNAPRSRTTLLSNVTGRGFVGQLLNKKALYETGQAIIKNARHISFGLGATVRGKSGGFPDLIGWTTIEITEKHIGKKIAVFTAIEVKRKGKKPSEIQTQRLELLKNAGALADWCDNADDAEELINRL